MKKLITMTLLALTLTSGVALADRDGRGRDRDRGRDHDRSGQRDRGRRGPAVRGDVRVNVRTNVRQPRRVRYERRVIRQNNNRFVFNGGISRTYVRPSFRTRYVNYRVRPQVYIENMAPVEGYVWMNGQWQWTGNEWVWQAGYYAPDPSYGQYGYYDDYSY